MGNETILIVEDERIIALDLRHRLEKLGFRVGGMFSSAEEALKALPEVRPELVLMDIMLAGAMDGIDAAKRIRAAHGLPVFFLTAYNDDKTIERAKTAEPYGYITKPFKDRDLHTTIEMGMYKARVDSRLRENEDWMSALLASVTDGLVACGPDGRVRLLNPAAESLTGWSQEEAAGRPVGEILRLVDERGEEPIALPGLDGALKQGPSFIKGVHLLSRQGASIPVEGSLACISAADRCTAGAVWTLRDVSEIRQLSDNLSYQASHDVLTGLLNREAFLVRLVELQAGSASGAAASCLLDVDLDQFRVINEVFGHVAGDELIRQTAAILGGAAGGNGITARLGGDEFAILLPGKTVAEGRLAAQNLVKSLKRFFNWQSNSVAVTASAGVVPVSGAFGDRFAILAAANDACRLAKEEGGNRVRAYESTDLRFMKRRGEMKWISRITRALDENRFCLYFQPLLALGAGKGLRRKIEILLRLREDGQIILPGEFIPAAERYQLMPAVDRWVIRETFRFLKEHQDKRHDIGMVVAINLSGSSLVDESFLDFISQQFFKYMLEPNLICFEITETAAIQNLSRAQRFIKSLRQLGCTFALDDFGNGFSSFAYLKTLSVDYLKIDGSFVKNITEDPIDFAMVEAVNNIGHVMGIQTIAEFVQSHAIQESLRLLGVDYAQGYFIGAPKPLAASELSS